MSIQASLCLCKCSNENILSLKQISAPNLKKMGYFYKKLHFPISFCPDRFNSFLRDFVHIFNIQKFISCRGFRFLIDRNIPLSCFFRGILENIKPDSNYKSYLFPVRFSHLNKNLSISCKTATTPMATQSPLSRKDVRFFKSLISSVCSLILVLIPLSILVSILTNLERTSASKSVIRYSLKFIL